MSQYGYPPQQQSAYHNDPFVQQPPPQQPPPGHHSYHQPSYGHGASAAGGAGGYNLHQPPSRPAQHQPPAAQPYQHHHSHHMNGHMNGNNQYDPPHHHAPAAPRDNGVYASPSEQHRSIGGSTSMYGGGTGSYAAAPPSGAASGQLMFKSPRSTRSHHQHAPVSQSRSTYSSQSHSDSAGGNSHSPPHTPSPYPRSHSPHPPAPAPASVISHSQSPHMISKTMPSVSSPPMYNRQGSSSPMPSPNSVPTFHTPSNGGLPAPSRGGGGLGPTHRSTPSGGSGSDASSNYHWSSNTPVYASNGQYSNSGGSSNGAGGGDDGEEVRRLSPAEREKLTIDEVIVPNVENLGPCPATVEEIASIGGNHECADCQTKDPNWVSINLGIFVCVDCAGTHRSLGTDYSKVRSLQLDSNWQNEEVVELLHRMGNDRAKLIYERCVPSFYIRPSSLPRNSTSLGAVRENWIKAKYMRKEFVSPKGVDESKESATIFAMPEPVLEGYLCAQSDGWRNKWQKRWFVLYHRYLLFYKDSNYSTAAGRYDVTEMTYDLSDNDSTSNTFVLRNSSGKEFPLIADTTTDMFMWIHALRRARIFYKGPQSKADMINSPAQDCMSTSKLRGATCSGFLVKQGGDVKNWKRRYFAILDSVLYYFKMNDPPDFDSNKEVKPKGYIHLSNCEVTSNGSSKAQRPHCFCVFTPDRQYFMCAEDAATMRQWVSAIEATASKTSRRVRVDFKQDGIGMRNGIGYS